MKKILITGAAGFLGENLYKKLKKRYEVVGIDIKKDKFVECLVDLTDVKKTKDFIEKAKVDIIIHTAALTDVEYCQTHQDESYNINVRGTKNLIDCLNNPKIKFIFISSDYVYDGVKGNFNEQSSTNPLNYYGKTKLEAEQIVKKHKNHLTLRSTVIFGWSEQSKNFFMQLFRNQKENNLMKVPTDQYSNPTYVNLLVEIIHKSIVKDLTGLFIATGPEALNRYDFALRTCDLFDFNKKIIIPVTTKDLNQVAPRPLNCSTCSNKIREELKIDFPSLKESLIDLKSSIYAKR